MSSDNFPRFKVQMACGYWFRHHRYEKTVSFSQPYPAAVSVVPDIVRVLSLWTYELYSHMKCDGNVTCCNGDSDRNVGG